MRRLLAAGILIAFSCTGQQIQITPPEKPHTQKPPVIADRQPTALKLLKKLKPRIRTLVARLGNASFKTREKAKKELLEIGLPAVPALEEAARSADPEVAHTAKAIAESLKPHIKRLIVTKDRSSVPDQMLKTILDSVTLDSLPGQVQLSQYVRLLKSSAKISVFIHPDLAAQNPPIRLEKQQYSLPGLLEIMAEKIDATWVARFGVLYLAKPEKALELADAEVITTTNNTDKSIFHSKTWHGTTISVSKETSLEKVLEFFSEICKFEFVFGEDVDPQLTVKPFEVKEIRLRDALSLLLFSLNLKGEFINMKITITRADFSHLSKDLQNVQTRLLLYRRAWENLEVPGK